MLLAAFANSPVVHGRRTGWKSSRMASWLALTPSAPARPPSWAPTRAGVRAPRARHAPALVRRDGEGGVSWEAPAVTFADWIDGALDPPPTRADLDYHLTTLFPPVRPQGHLEVRYLDQQAGDEWVVPLAVVAALMQDPDTVARARAAAEPAVGRWTAAARHGLDDRVLRRAAGELFAQARRTLAGPAFADLDAAVRDLVDRVVTERVLRGRCPADEPLDDAEDRCPRPATARRRSTPADLDPSPGDRSLLEVSSHDRHRHPGRDRRRAALRRRLAADLEAARARTRALTHDVFGADDADFTRQHSPLMSPFHWDVAHIANMEDFWLVRRGAPDTEVVDGVREDLDHLYDAFTNPRAGRPALPLLDPAEARAYGERCASARWRTSTPRRSTSAAPWPGASCSG